MQDSSSNKEAAIERDENVDPLQHISYLDIASKLLADKLLLTALELHCELTEAGKEVSKLKEFFSNPGNFEAHSSRNELSTGSVLTRWSSQATLDSLDLTRYSEDGEKVTDDKIAVLEFELRKARETINSLRTNLTVATECENQNRDSSVYRSNDPIKPYEQRALNFLINEYLLSYGYKLTSITFADENEDQDFEVWDDVGLNIPKPQELLYLYRDSMKRAGHVSDMVHPVASQTDACADYCDLLIVEYDKLKERVAELEQENAILTESIERVKKDVPDTAIRNFTAPTSESGSSHDYFIVTESSNQTLTENYSKDNISEDLRDISCNLDEPKDNQVLDDSRDVTLFDKYKEDFIAASNEPIDDALEEESDNMSDESNIDWDKVDSQNSSSRNEDYISNFMRTTENVSKHVPISFQKELLSKCYVDSGVLISDITCEYSDYETMLEHIINVFAHSLRIIVPHVAVNKREELVLFFVYMIRLHPDMKVRQKFIQLLFNIKKKPSEKERKIISSGVVWLIRNWDLNLIENELLPSFWDQLSHKYVERRLLVSEMCNTITPFVTNSTRTSFLLPVLQQMLLEDKEERVRISVINSIALIASLVEDDKYSQCEELVFTGLQDCSAFVVQCTVDSLLPIMGKWALDTGRLQSHLFSRLLGLLSTQIKSVALQQKADSGSPFKQSLSWENKCAWTVLAIRSLLPYLVISVAAVDDVIQIVQPNLPLAQPRIGFSELCRGLYNPAIFYEGVHSIGVLISAFDACVINKTWLELEWVANHMLRKLLDCLDQVTITQNDLIISFISLFHSIIAGFGKLVASSKVQTVFVEKLQVIESKLANVTEEWPSLSILAVYLLAVLVPLQDIQSLQETLQRFLFILPLAGYPLDVLSFCVKELGCISSVEEPLMNVLWEGVVHARETVRSSIPKLFISAIPNVSNFTITNRIMPALVTLSNDADMNVKTATIPAFVSLIKNTSIKELQTFLSEPNIYEHHTLLIQLLTSFTDIASNCDTTFRDDVLAHYLATSSAYASQLTNTARKLELFRVLLEAYTAIVYCPLSRNTVHSVILPGLRHLESIAYDSSSTTYKDNVSSLIKDLDSRFSHESGNASSSTAAFVPIGQEMKQKMSKIFQTPMSKHTRFWKK